MDKDVLTFDRIEIEKKKKDFTVIRLLFFGEM